jgi:hypothetical protein
MGIEEMSTPAIIVIILLAMGFGLHTAKHGEPRSDFHAGWYLFGAAVNVGLLYWGGFFS